MSTPVRPKLCNSRIKKPIRSSIVKRPSGYQEKFISSPVRHNPIARTYQKEVLKAPKTKRVRQSRLFSPDSLICNEEVLPTLADRLASQSYSQLPVPRLYFENDDFMEMYSDGPETPELSCDNRDSMTFLTQCLTDGFHTLLTDSPLPNSSELTASSSSTSPVPSTNNVSSGFAKKTTRSGKVSTEQKH